MKIAIFTDTFWPTSNGVVSSIFEMIKALTKNKHEVMVFAPKFGDISELLESLPLGVSLHLVPAIDMTRLYPEQKLGLANLSIISKFKDFDPDIVHTHTPMSLGFQGFLLAKRFGKSLVTTHHTNYSDKESLKALSWLSPIIGIPLQKGVGEIIKIFLKRHEFIIVPTKDTLEDLLSMGIKRKMTIIPSPVNIEELQAGRVSGQKLKKELGIKNSLIFVGRLSGEKRIDQVIKIFNLALKKKPDLKLVLIGDGPNQEDLFNLASGLGINKSVVWVGDVMHQKLVTAGYYYLGDVFITMSKFETQGLSTLEAMACGLPVVAVDARANKEIVGKDGYLINDGDLEKAAETIIELFEKKTLYAKVAGKSKLRAQLFSPEIFAKKLIAVYKGLL